MENDMCNLQNYTITRCAEGGYVVSTPRYREQGLLFASTTVAEALEFVRSRIEVEKPNA